jgi:hypothetical protein
LLSALLRPPVQTAAVWRSEKIPKHVNEVNMSKTFPALAAVLMSAALLSFSTPSYCAKEIEPNTLPE